MARVLILGLITAVTTAGVVAQQAPVEMAPVVARLAKTYDKAPDGQEYFYIRALTIEPQSGAIWLAYGLGSEAPVRIDRTTGVAKVIGRSGSGPNEYRRPIAMQPGAQGDVGIWDTGRRMWLWVDSVGVHGRTWPVPTNSVNMTKIFTDVNGRVYLGQWTPPGPARTEVAVRVDSAAGLRDTMRLPMPIPQAGGWTWRGSSGGGSVTYSTRVLFSANVVWGVDRLGRMVAARSDSNFVIVRDGQSEKRLLLPNWRDPLTAADRQSATKELDRFDSTARAEGGVLDGPRPAIPAVRPQIDGLLPEVNGGITVLRTRPCSRFPGWRAPITGATAVADTAQCTIVERFDASGLRLAPFTLGPSDQLRVIRADTAWITRSDSLGVAKILELVIPRR